MKTSHKISIIVIVSIMAIFTFLSTKYLQNSAQTDLTTIKGKILKGEYLDNLPYQCSNQYFLVNGDSQTWLIPQKEDRADWPKKISRNVFSEAKVTGKKIDGYKPCMYIPEMSACNCDNYLEVESVKNTFYPKRIGNKYTGQLSCKNNPNSQNCEYVFKTQNGEIFNVYPNSKADLSAIKLDKNISITGILRNSYLSTSSANTINILDY